MSRQLVPRRRTLNSPLGLMMRRNPPRYFSVKPGSNEGLFIGEMIKDQVTSVQRARQELPSSTEEGSCFHNGEAAGRALTVLETFPRPARRRPGGVAPACSSRWDRTRLRAPPKAFPKPAESECRLGQPVPSPHRRGRRESASGCP